MGFVHDINCEIVHTPETGCARLIRKPVKSEGTHHWVILNYDYRTVIGYGKVHDDGAVHLTIRDPRIVDLVRRGEEYIEGLSVTTEPAVEAQKDVSFEIYQTFIGLYIILRNDTPMLDSQGQALVFYRRIDAERKMESLKITHG